MGVLLTIKPKNKFPQNIPFELTDKYNGPHRGTWWWNDTFNNVQGPFWTYSQAQDNIDENVIIAPHQDQHGLWWWSDAAQHFHGPYTHLRDADAAIVAHHNKDTK